MLKLEKYSKLTQAYTTSPNVANRFSQKDQDAIAETVFAGYQADKASRNKWERRTDAALNLALQITQSKNFPWPNCSNIAFPLVTIAALQFHSQAYPTIFQDVDLVKYRTPGNDPNGAIKARGDVISAHMSYQLTELDQSWEEQHDRLLLCVPIVGCGFVKSYYSAVERHNVSELVLAHDLVTDYFAKSVESARRKTHRVPLYRNDIYEKVMAEVYCDVLDDAWFKEDAPVTASVHDAEENRRTGTTTPLPDASTPFYGLEQHCWLDLDNDGYEEPYIITIEESSHKLLRIVTRFEWEDVRRLSTGKILSIRSTEYFTKYGFIPSPDGSIYDLGFGVLLGPLNETTNSIINQLVDAGTMSNAGGGFLTRGAKMRGGQISLAPLEWRTVDVSGDDLRKSVFPIPVREPSHVLFQLLGLIINYTGRIAGTTDTMVGENPGQNTPAQTTQTLVDNGMRVFKAIFKRTWRSMREELAKLYILNSVYLPAEPITFGQDDKQIQRFDYLQAPPNAVMPASDPNAMSSSVRMQIATAVKQAAMATPGYNRDAVERLWLKTLGIEAVDVLFPGSDKVPAGQDPKLLIAQMKLKSEQDALEFEKMKFIAELQETRRLNQAKIVEMMADAALSIEQAGDMKENLRISAFNAAIGALKQHNDHLTKQLELLIKGVENGVPKQTSNAGAGRVPTLVAPSGNTEPVENPFPMEGG
jgi:hypothetical protein